MNELNSGDHLISVIKKIHSARTEDDERLIVELMIVICHYVQMNMIQQYDSRPKTERDTYLKSVVVGKEI